MPGITKRRDLGRFDTCLTFYINRADKDLPAERENVLKKAKEEPRAAFGR
ncbi:MAG TPA: DUF3175 domain-containing protein [Sphingomonas sp.]